MPRGLNHFRSFGLREMAPEVSKVGKERPLLVVEDEVSVVEVEEKDEEVADRDVEIEFEAVV